MNAAERMKKLRQKRKDAKLKEYRFWLKTEIYEEVKDILKNLENLSLKEEKEKNTESLKNSLNEILKKYNSWDNYYQDKNGISIKSQEELTSTRKQRKFAFLIARATKQYLPDTSILSNRFFISEWIYQQIKKYKLAYIYDWEKLAEEYGFVQCESRG